jgi:hypothetical protein
VIFGGIDTVVRNQVWALEDLSGTYTGVRDISPELVLPPNYPNPFNPGTTVEYVLPVQGPVTVRVFDVTGSPVRTLVDEVQPAGAQRVRWDGRSDAGGGVASGVYLLRIEAAGIVRTRKMTMLK